MLRLNAFIKLLITICTFVAIPIFANATPQILITGFSDASYNGIYSYTQGDTSNEFLQNANERTLFLSNGNCNAVRDFLVGSLVFRCSGLSYTGLQSGNFSNFLDTGYNHVSGTAEIYIPPPPPIEMIPPNNFISSLATSTKTAVSSVLPLTAVAVAIPLSFWVIIQIMGLFPRIRGGVSLANEKETLTDINK